MNCCLLNHTSFIQDSRYVLSTELQKGPFYTSYKLPFTPLNKIIGIMLQKRKMLVSNLKNNHIDYIKYQF